MTTREKEVLSYLLSEIQDKSLENILRRSVLSGENVIAAMHAERPETRDEISVEEPSKFIQVCEAIEDLQIWDYVEDESKHLKRFDFMNGNVSFWIYDTENGILVQGKLPRRVKEVLTKFSIPFN